MAETSKTIRPSSTLKIPRTLAFDSEGDRPNLSREGSRKRTSVRLSKNWSNPCPRFDFEEVAHAVVDDQFLSDQFRSTGKLARLDEIGAGDDKGRREEEQTDHGPGSSAGSNVGQSIVVSALVCVMKTPLSGSKVTTHSLELRSSSTDA